MKSRTRSQTKRVRGPVRNKAIWEARKLKAGAHQTQARPGRPNGRSLTRDWR